MKQCCLILMLTFSFWATAQQKPTVTRKTFIKYKDYKEKKLDANHKIDSLGFQIFRNDTVIEITPLERNGVSVPYEYKDSIFLKEYKKLVYNKDNQKKTATSKPTMKYWKDKIKVYFDSTVTSKSKKELTKFFKYLDEEIDSLKISIVNKKSESNYFIYFINREDDINWEERIMASSDGFYLNWDGRQRIYNCTLKLDTRKIFNEKQQMVALKKHIVFSLGYFNAILGRECKSFFSSCMTLDKELTTSDLELLRYHYSYGICKGTDLETFEKNHQSAQAHKKEDPKTIMEFFHPKE